MDRLAGRLKISYSVAYVEIVYFFEIKAK